MMQQENSIGLKRRLKQKGSEGDRRNLRVLVLVVSTIKPLRIVQSLTWYIEAGALREQVVTRMSYYSVRDNPKLEPREQ